MTVSEKYVNMNNCFCKLRDAIYESNVDEKDEDPVWGKNIETALMVIMSYLDYYKDLNEVKSHVKGTENEQQPEITHIKLEITAKRPQIKPDDDGDSIA